MEELKAEKVSWKGISVIDLNCYSIQALQRQRSPYSVGELLILPGNTILACKNTLAYFSPTVCDDVNRFITLINEIVQ